jgi:beta-galactosidase
LQQDGGTLSGSVEGLGGGWFGGDDVPSPIMGGKVDGARVEFKAGNNSYKGTVKGDQIELERSFTMPWERPKPAPESPNRPAIGPPPDGTDPSIGTSWHMPESIPVILRRVEPGQ